MIRSLTTGFAVVIAGVTASTLLLSTPAYSNSPTPSAPYTPGSPITVGGTTWSVDGAQLSAAANSLGDPFLHTEFRQGNGGGTEADCEAPSPLATDSNGDVTLLCTGFEEDDAGLSTSVHWTFFTEGDLARQLVFVENNSDSPKPLVWTMNFQFEAAISTNPPQATSTNPTLMPRIARPLRLADNWTYNDSRAAILNAAIAWGHTNASVRHTDAISGSTLDQIVSDPVVSTVIQPDQTAVVAFYYKIDLAGSALQANQIDVPSVTNEFNSFTGRLVRGLPEGRVVQNWGTVPSSAPPATPAPPVTAPAAPSAPELAETGLNVVAVPLGILALTGLLAGGTMLVARHRRAETTTTV